MVIRSLHSFFVNHIEKYTTQYNLNYNWGYGSLSGIFYVIQVLTGVVLASHYVSHELVVFENLEHIMRDVEFGWLLRYMHLNGASFFFIAVMVVVVVLSLGAVVSWYGGVYTDLPILFAIVFIFSLVVDFLKVTAHFLYVSLAVLVLIILISFCCRFLEMANSMLNEALGKTRFWRVFIVNAVPRYSIEFNKQKTSRRELKLSRMFVLSVSGFIEQSKDNILLDLWAENPYSLLANFLFVFLILYYFLTGRKFGFYTIFYFLFTSILAKCLGQKFLSNYLFVPANLKFFYLLFLYSCWENVAYDLVATSLWHIPTDTLFILFIAAFAAGIIKSNLNIPKVTVPFTIPAPIVSFSAIAEAIWYVARLLNLSILLLSGLMVLQGLLKAFFIVFDSLSTFSSGGGVYEILGVVVYVFCIFLKILLLVVQAAVVTSFAAIYLKYSVDLIKNRVDTDTNKPFLRVFHNVVAVLFFFFKVYVFSGSFEQFVCNAPQQGDGGGSLYVVGFFLTAPLIFYFLVTKKRFGCYEIFCGLFFFALTKIFRKKDVYNYLLLSPISLRFFYLLFLCVGLQNAFGFDSATDNLCLLLIIRILIIFFVTSVIVGFVKSGSWFPRTSVLLKIPSMLVPFLSTVERAWYFARLLGLSAKLFINLLVVYCPIKLLYTALNFFLLSLSSDGASLLLITIGFYVVFFIKIVVAALHGVVVTGLIGFYLIKLTSLIRNPQVPKLIAK